MGRVVPNLYGIGWDKKLALKQLQLAMDFYYDNDLFVEQRSDKFFAKGSKGEKIFVKYKKKSNGLWAAYI